MINDNIYLPVHNGFGFIIAGYGNSPFQFSKCINKSYKCFLSKKISFKVKSIIPSNES